MEGMEVYEELRPLLFSIAYRMIGSVGEAEDIVQEAFLRFHKATTEGTKVESAKGYLSQVTTRLCIDHLRSARSRRERYVGQWLPEPLVTDEGSDAERHAETADSLSMAFLVLLERLSPVGRAVFLLREVFGYDYKEIAGVVDKSEENCRQLASRAKHRVEEGKPRFEVSRRERDELARRFFAAVQEGNLQGLTALLSADAVMYGDGGGKVPAVAEPVHGGDRVARFLLGLARVGAKLRLSYRPAELNGQPGVIVVDEEDETVGVLALDIAGGTVQTVRSIVNPDKLRHIGPVADWNALVRRAGDS